MHPFRQRIVRIAPPSLLRCFPVLLCSIAGGVAVAQTRPTGEAAITEWASVLQKYREERTRIASIELDFTCVTEVNPPTDIRTIGGSGRCSRTEQAVNYGQSQAKYYQRTAIKWLDVHGNMIGKAPCNDVVADNGKQNMERNDLMPGFILIKASGGESVRGALTPMTVLNPMGPDWIDERQRKGVARLDSIRPDTLDGKNVLVVRCTLPKSGHTIVLFLSPEQGWLPVKSQAFASTGALENESLITEIASINAADRQIVHYPVGGTMRTIVKGVDAVRQVISVSRETVRVNSPIPDTRFELFPKPGEILSDVDRKLRLPNPADNGL